ncbi:MAG TPA: CHAD domain-containing protein [Kofleriaceae bacterium]
MTATSLLDDGIELRRSLFLEFRTAAEDVRQAAAAADAGLAAAVHDYRKGLRRARALLRLVAGELPKTERRDLQRALTEARRSLGAARDHSVANDVLGHLEGEPEREAALAVLDAAAAAAMTTIEIKQLLAEGAARTAAQVELLDAALPARIEWSVIREGLRDTYKQARTARRASKKSRRAFHTWRRRSKELVIQLEILARTAAPQLEQIRQQILDATDQLGDTVDLLMARDFVRLHADGIDKQRIDLLTQALDRELDRKAREGRRDARDAFRKKPRELARKLAKASQDNGATVATPPLVRGEEFAMT